MGGKTLVKNTLVLGIIALLLCVSVIPSTECNDELSLLICSDEPFGIRTFQDSPYNKNFNICNEFSAGRKIAYGFSYTPDFYGPWWFYLDGPEFDLGWPYPSESGPFLSGGTWANEERWIACEYFSGALWENSPVNEYMESIGGGGTGLNGLAYNPVNEKLYGASSSALYEIDIETGNQTYIGSFTSGPDTMVGIAFDEGGVLYGWDIGTDNLWTIDIDTGEAELVGSLGINLNYAQDGAFEFEDDILYLSAYTLSPNYGHYLYKCDEDTGECTLVGSFQLDIVPFAIPYGGQFPIKPEISGPTHGRLGLLNKFSIDNVCNAIWYKWNWGDGNYSSLPSHKWTKLGTYNISVNARNLYGAIESEQINIQIEDFHFNNAFVFGRINDVHIKENITIIEADSLLYFGNPVGIGWYHSGERMAISEKIFGRIKNNFVFGYFKMDIIG